MLITGPLRLRLARDPGPGHLGRTRGRRHTYWHTSKAHTRSRTRISPRPSRASAATRPVGVGIVVDALQLHTTALLPPIECLVTW